MDTQLLIQSIVRQTTVLLAQISTAAGLRAPLAHVADQVFHDLARELESQGVRRNVVADMFGLALRSYQLKTRRALESAQVQRSLWRDIYVALGAGTITRRELEKRFDQFESKSISAVLNDLVDSGLAYCTGRGMRAAYGLLAEGDVARLASDDDELSLAQHLWLQLVTQGTRSGEELARELNVDAERVTGALGRLLKDERVTEREGKFDALSFDIPLDSEMGWEASVCDHFRAVANAIGNKLSDQEARADDRVGGTTLTFTIHTAHPYSAEIYGLLARTRRELNALWEAASAHNAEHGVPAEADRVTFYFGQNVTRGGPSG
jgi:hypothetical protein